MAAMVDELAEEAVGEPANGLALDELGRRMASPVARLRRMRLRKCKHKCYVDGLRNPSCGLGKILLHLTSTVYATRVADLEKKMWTWKEIGKFRCKKTNDAVSYWSKFIRKRISIHQAVCRIVGIFY